jgi:alkanesulfonate monooxygenase SsuD/methylene tetrahydromethanopterin reductase-like flavin-dependent oxidoreductase (luciferase family)
VVTFGTIMAPRNHPDRPRPLPEIYSEYISDAVYLEQLGFEFAWIGEHRMTPCQWTPSPLTMAAAMAARTSVLRVGTSVLCLPFHNPLRVAEDIAVIDNISGGRFDFGFGVGSHWDEFATFGLPIKRRWSITMESAQLIERCLTETRPFDHHGEFFTFTGIDFTTRPVQRPLPFWAGGAGTKTVDLAAERGWHLMVERPARYDQQLEANGRSPAEYFAAPMQMVCIAPTHDEAVESSLEGLHYFRNFYALRRQPDGSVPDPATAEVTREMIRQGDLGGFAPPVVGTPDEAYELLAPLMTTPGVTHLPLSFRHAGMRTPEVRQSMDLFATEVLPALRALETTPAATP